MTKIKRLDPESWTNNSGHVERMVYKSDGRYVHYDDHLAAIEALKASQVTPADMREHAEAMCKLLFPPNNIEEIPWREIAKSDIDIIESYLNKVFLPVEKKQPEFEPPVNYAELISRLEKVVNQLKGIE